MASAGERERIPGETGWELELTDLFEHCPLEDVLCNDVKCMGSIWAVATIGTKTPVVKLKMLSMQF